MTLAIQHQLSVLGKPGISVRLLEQVPKTDWFRFMVVIMYGSRNELYEIFYVCAAQSSWRVLL